MFDTDIPVPDRRKNGAKYPFILLSAGESVLYPCSKEDSKKARVAAYEIARRHSWDVVVRWDKTGIRVWRVK
jgi:hypothetical protein